MMVWKKGWRIVDDAFLNIFPKKNLFTELWNVWSIQKQWRGGKMQWIKRIEYLEFIKTILLFSREIGLDFVKNVSPADVQINVFRRQAKKAAELGKPVVIHSRLINSKNIWKNCWMIFLWFRNAEKETLQILKECFPKVTIVKEDRRLKRILLI